MTVPSPRLLTALACFALTTGGGSAAFAQTIAPQEKLGLEPPRVETNDSGQTVVTNDARSSQKSQRNSTQPRLDFSTLGMLRMLTPPRLGLKFGVYLAGSGQVRRQDGGLPAILGLTYRLQGP